MKTTMMRNVCVCEVLSAHEFRERKFVLVEKTKIEFERSLTKGRIFKKIRERRTRRRR